MSRLRTLACALDRAAARAPLSPALLVPEQGKALSYGELSRSTRAFAAGLRAWGIRAGDVIVSDLPNVSENLALQIAASRAGAAVATVKDAEALFKLAVLISATGGRVSGTVAASASSFLSEAAPSLPLGSILAGAALEAMMRGPPHVAPEDAASTPESTNLNPALAYWNSTAPLTHVDALAQGAAAAKQLALTGEDRVCVAITLCHAFGTSACAAALYSGAAIVLPAVGGIRGCGIPEQRAAVTLRVLAAERCSVLFADTHTLKALETPELVEARKALDLSALRAGACKVGSGADFLDPCVEFAGVKVRTVGKRGATDRK